MKTYEYDSFGNEVKPDEKDDNPFRYCGEYYDKETGEVHLRARYYQPEKGRFLTRDTYTGEEDEPESLHLYTYCYNDPVMYSDISGNSPSFIDLVLKGATVGRNVIKSNEKRQKRKHNQEMNKFINGEKKKVKKETPKQKSIEVKQAL